MEKFTQINNEYQVREETFNGKSYLVAPVVMMTPGVREGSDGPLLYTHEELSRDPSIWNETPVVINHPADENGNPTTVNNASQESIVGIVRNSLYNIEGQQLRAEVWLEKEKLRSNASEVAERIQNQRPLEVSIGVFAKKQNEQGEYNGQVYNAIAREYRSDHLALLPNTQGACSWDDGCGIRLNEKNMDVKKVINDLIPNGYKLTVFENNQELTINQKGFHEISQMIQSKLNTFDNEVNIFFLEEVFEDHFIYRVRNIEENDMNFFKRNYTVGEDGKIMFEGDTVKVVKNVTYDEISNNNKNANNMATNKECKKVDALISNKATKFTEDDREWLQGLEDATLDKMIPEQEPAVANEAGKISEDQVKEIFNQYTDPEEFINNWMPAELKDQMKSAMRMYREKRENLVEGIVNNSSFEKEKLDKWSTEDLETLHSSIVPKQYEGTDYSVFGNESSKSGGKELSEELKIMFNVGEEA